MVIELTRQYLTHAPGTVLDLAPGLAKTLIAQGRARALVTGKRVKSGGVQNKAIQGAEVKHGTC